MTYQKHVFNSGDKLYASQLNAMNDAIETLATAKISIAKDHHNILINCEGLTAGKTYKIKLFSRANHRGAKTGFWKEVKEEESGYVGTLKGKVRRELKLADAENKIPYDDSDIHLSKDGTTQMVYERFTAEKPYWMPNGNMTVEWEFTAEGSTYTKTIEVEQWMLDNIKPQVSNSFDSFTQTVNGVEYTYHGSLIGTAKNTHGSLSSLHYKFGCFDESDNLIALSNETVNIGPKIKSTGSGTVRFVTVGGSPYKVTNLYISVK